MSASTAVMFLILMLSACVNTENQPAPVNIGDIIQFGGFEWRVLALESHSMLIITENIIERRPFHNTFEAVTWETSSIRAYLNGEFLNIFSEAERARIFETTVINNDNPWFLRDGGNDTVDRVFLLSLEELVRYFGDSGILKDGGPCQFTFALLFDDQYRGRRAARDADGYEVSWWLRSVGGRFDGFVAYVGQWGYVHVDGIDVYPFDFGVRPALWLSR